MSVIERELRELREFVEDDWDNETETDRLVTLFYNKLEREALRRAVRQELQRRKKGR